MWSSSESMTISSQGANPEAHIREVANFIDDIDVRDPPATMEPMPPS
jgi:hypothetical protein